MELLRAWAKEKLRLNTGTSLQFTQQSEIRALAVMRSLRRVSSASET